jgi:hypothetical protein
MEAKIINNMIVIQNLCIIEGEMVCIVNCSDFDHYKKLPEAIQVKDKILGKAGWSSDSNYCCYKSNVVLGRFVDRYL